MNDRTARGTCGPESDERAVRPAVQLLWTGGWDSTFRLLSLLLIEGRSVQPHYIVDRRHYRPGLVAEQQAMRRIRERIAERYPDAAARLRPMAVCSVADIPAHAQIEQHYEGCLRAGFIGGQYEWLARYCAAHGIEAMELSIHRDDKARTLLAPLMGPSGARLDARHAGDPRYELFKWFEFPLFDATKQQMRTAARSAGFEDIMSLTWFCHRPRGGEACGVCNPCIYTIEEGLGDRVPLAGRLRYALRVVPRLRHWLARHPGLYLRVRALYRRVRPARESVAASGEL